MMIEDKFRNTSKLSNGPHNFIIETLMNAGYDAYVVGGCVRDVLMDRNPKDWDICTSATPEEVEEVFSSYKIIETGLKHGTVTVVINDEPFEVTTFRTESEYSDGRHPDHVDFVGSIQEDLARRDFTINAIAFNSDAGFVDPFGGCLDIQNKIIRCVGDADKRFQEDALRILRALRFASVLGFQIEKSTAESIHRHEDWLQNISAERIQSEFCKVLFGEHVLDVLLEFRDVIGIIIPEMEQCFDFNQNNKYHQYTVYDHIAHAVANYKGDDSVVKLALLLHDIGKPYCYTEDANGGHFYGHAELSSTIADRILERLKFDNDSRNNIIELIEVHDSTIEPTTKTVRRWLSRIGETQFMRLMYIRLADIRAHAEGTQQSRINRRDRCLEIAQEIIKQNKCFRMKDLKINGDDILDLGVPEGKEIGAILNKVLKFVVDEELENDRDVLLNFLKLEITST